MVRFKFRTSFRKPPLLYTLTTYHFAQPLLAIEDADRSTREQIDELKHIADARRKGGAKAALKDARLLQGTGRRLKVTYSAASCNSIMSDGEFAPSCVPTGGGHCSPRICIIQ